jgi:peptidoglycan/LPS O-acetylase OafA/YrhL
MSFSVATEIYPHDEGGIKFRFKPEPAPPSEPRRLDFLDGLRGVAALVVVLFHFLAIYLVWKNSLPVIHVLGIFLDGPFAVGIFFVLSGFVLAHSSAKRRTPLLLQLFLRYFRLTVPMTVALLIGCVFLKITAVETSSGTGIVARTPGIGKALQDGLWNVYSTNNPRVNGSITPVIWTMRVELLGSIFIYFVYRFLSGWPRLLTLCLFAPLHPFYLGFPLGALLREGYVHRVIRESRWSWLALLGGLYLSGNHAPLDSFRALTMGAALLVYALLANPFLQRLLSGKIPLFLGKISFCLYLLHFPILIAIDAAMAAHFGFSVTGRAGLVFIPYLVSSITLALLMSLAVDEPLIRLLHRIARRFQGGGVPKGA